MVSWCSTNSIFLSVHGNSAILTSDMNIAEGNCSMSPSDVSGGEIVNLSKLALISLYLLTFISVYVRSNSFDQFCLLIHYSLVWDPLSVLSASEECQIINCC